MVFVAADVPTPLEVLLCETALEDFRLVIFAGICFCDPTLSSLLLFESESLSEEQKTVPTDLFPLSRKGNSLALSLVRRETTAALLLLVDCRFCATFAGGDVSLSSDELDDDFEPEPEELDELLDSDSDELLSLATSFLSSFLEVRFVGVLTSGSGTTTTAVSEGLSTVLLICSAAFFAACL